MRSIRIALSATALILTVLVAGAAATEYVIGAADVLAISVLDNRELDTVAAVTPGGKIAVPLIGDVQASGLTVAELTKRLTQEFAKKVKFPEVMVSLREVNSYRIYFLGKVARPGVLAIKSEVTLLQAISLAGGIQEGADLALAYLARGSARVPVNFVALLQQGDLSQNVLLNPDDTVVIPDNPRNVIYVTGEVKTPGMLPFVKERGATALQAVVAAGGFTTFAARTRGHILRDEGGRRSVLPLDFNDLMQSGKDIPLNPGDILVVPQRMF